MSTITSSYMQFSIKHPQLMRLFIYTSFFCFVGVVVGHSNLSTHRLIGQTLGLLIRYSAFESQWVDQKKIILGGYMSIQELCNEIDNQYSLYTSEQGADADICKELFKLMSDLTMKEESLDEPDFMEYYQKIANIMMHRIDGVVISNNIKQKYTISNGVVRVQII